LKVGFLAQKKKPPQLGIAERERQMSKAILTIKPAPESCKLCPLVKRRIDKDKTWGTYEFYLCGATDKYVGDGGKFYKIMQNARAPFCPFEIIEDGDDNA